MCNYDKSSVSTGIKKGERNSNSVIKNIIPLIAFLAVFLAISVTMAVRTKNIPFKLEAVADIRNKLRAVNAQMIADTILKELGKATAETAVKFALVLSHWN